MSGFMDAMYWLGAGVRKSARLTVQGISTGWFEPRGWTGCRGTLRRAVGGDAQVGDAGGKLAFPVAVAGVGRDRD
jgi:hypothetical protein